MKKIYRTLIILLLFAIIANFSYRIDLNRAESERVGELAYFPSGYMIRTLAIGNQAMLADIIWLRFIQYYGEHRMTDLQYEYMYHILDILTTLDPHFVHAYNLGALMLTHDAKRPDQAFKLLKKGMAQDPDEWRIPFMYAFIQYVFLRDYTTALTYFRISAQLPGATDMPKRWAGYLALKMIGDLKRSLALWVDLYNNAKSAEEKRIAFMYIQETRMNIELDSLNKLVVAFKTKHGRPPAALKELMSSGLMVTIPDEPHGERYILKKGRVTSTWEERRIQNRRF